jgi:hypothetical protein
MIASGFLASRSIRLAFAFVLLLVASLFGTASVAHDESGAADVVIFRATWAQDKAYELVPLDPVTLADVAETSSTTSVAAFMPWTVIFSQDGSTMAGMSEDGTITIQRGLGGPVVTTIQASDGWTPLQLSADGSRLLVWFHSQMDALAWRMIDTETGEKIVEFQLQTGGPQSTLRHVVDPQTRTLYRLIKSGVERPGVVKTWGSRGWKFQEGPDLINGYEPRPTTLIAIDLMTGGHIGTVELPDVPTSNWVGDNNPEPNSFSPATQFVVPGVAVSPDGSEIAIVNAADDRVTLVTAKSMTIKRTLTMHEPQSRIDNLFALLPLAPQTASAKFSQDVSRMAEYSTDGRSLYVSGREAWVEDIEQLYRGQGLSRVNLENGEIESRVLDGVAVDRVIETEGGDVFFVGNDHRSERSAYNPSTAIARLSEDGSEVVAERTFTDYVEFVIVPTP